MTTAILYFVPCVFFLGEKITKPTFVLLQSIGSSIKLCFMYTSTFTLSKPFSSEVHIHFVGTCMCGTDFPNDPAMKHNYWGVGCVFKIDGNCDTIFKEVLISY